MKKRDVWGNWFECHPLFCEIFFWIFWALAALAFHPHPPMVRRPGPKRPASAGNVGDGGMMGMSQNYWSHAKWIWFQKWMCAWITLNHYMDMVQQCLPHHAFIAIPRKRQKKNRQVQHPTKKERTIQHVLSFWQLLRCVMIINYDGSIDSALKNPYSETNDISVTWPNECTLKKRVTLPKRRCSGPALPRVAKVWKPGVAVGDTGSGPPMGWWLQGILLTKIFWWLIGQ